jgi:hypothetical protein
MIALPCPSGQAGLSAVGTQAGSGSARQINDIIESKIMSSRKKALSA